MQKRILFVTSGVTIATIVMMITAFGINLPHFNKAHKTNSESIAADELEISYPETSLLGKPILNGREINKDTPPGTFFKDCEICPIMVVVPPGTFVPTLPKELDSLERKPQISVSGPFAISVYETRFIEWDSARKAGATIKSSNYDRFDGGNRPVIHVRHSDITPYIEWLNDQLYPNKEFSGDYRLPTEPEWEYVARAGSEHPYHFGDKFDPNMVANSDSSTERVGQYKPNSFGVFDMHGNVWEWTSGCWRQDYFDSFLEEVEQEDCDKHPIRGGSWGREPESMRADSRLGSSSHGFRLGFRVARDIR